jgi:hypothetical protein
MKIDEAGPHLIVVFRMLCARVLFEEHGCMSNAVIAASPLGHLGFEVGTDGKVKAPEPPVPLAVCLENLESAATIAIRAVTHDIGPFRSAVIIGRRADELGRLGIDHLGETVKGEQKVRQLVSLERLSGLLHELWTRASVAARHSAEERLTDPELRRAIVAGALACLEIVAPDARTGAKTGRRAATKGHEAVHGTSEQKKQRWANLQAKVDKVRVQNPHLSKAAVRRNVAVRMGVSEKTVQRRTTDSGPRKIGQ